MRLTLRAGARLTAPAYSPRLFVALLREKPIGLVEGRAGDVQSTRNERREWGAMMIQPMVLGELFPAADPRPFAPPGGWWRIEGKAWVH